MIQLARNGCAKSEVARVQQRISVIMNQFSMAEKAVVQKNSGRSKLEFLEKELANAQRRREGLGLTMVVTGEYGNLTWNASLLPLMMNTLP